MLSTLYVLPHFSFSTLRWLALTHVGLECSSAPEIATYRPDCFSESERKAAASRASLSPAKLTTQTARSEVSPAALDYTGGQIIFHFIYFVYFFLFSLSALSNLPLPLRPSFPVPLLHQNSGVIFQKRISGESEFSDVMKQHPDSRQAFSTSRLGGEKVLKRLQGQLLWEPTLLPEWKRKRRTYQRLLPPRRLDSNSCFHLSQRTLSYVYFMLMEAL